MEVLKRAGLNRKSVPSICRVDKSKILQTQVVQPITIQDPCPAITPNETITHEEDFDFSVIDERPTGRVIECSKTQIKGTQLNEGDRLFSCNCSVAPSNTQTCATAQNWLSLEDFWLREELYHDLVDVCTLTPLKPNLPSPSLSDFILTDTFAPQPADDVLPCSP